LLCNAVAEWGKSLGCVEFGSDAPLENAASHALHAALGFAETQRVVFFRKTL
jgi:aminoglycoside 6'-N-acetyltransferase I